MIVVGVLGASGCASLVSGSTQKFQFESRPSGAVVWIDGKQLGHTPITVDLPRKRSYGVQIQQGGYETFELVLRRRTNVWYWTNLLYGTTGLIGVLVDSITGAMWSLSARHYRGAGEMMQHEGDSRIYVRVLMMPLWIARAGPRSSPPRASGPPERAMSQVTSLGDTCGGSDTGARLVGGLGGAGTWSRGPDPRGAGGPP